MVSEYVCFAHVPASTPGEIGEEAALEFQIAASRRLEDGRNRCSSMDCHAGWQHMLQRVLNELAVHRLAVGSSFIVDEPRDVRDPVRHVGSRRIVLVGKDEYRTGLQKWWR